MSNSIIVYVPSTVKLSAVFDYYSTFGEIIDRDDQEYPNNDPFRLVKIAFTDNQSASQALMNVAEHKINGVQLIVQPGSAATHSQVFRGANAKKKKAPSSGTSASAGKAPAKKKTSGGTSTSAGKAPAKKKTSGSTSAGQAGEASTSASAGSLPVSVPPVPNIITVTEAELSAYFAYLRSVADTNK